MTGPDVYDGRQALIRLATVNDKVLDDALKELRKDKVLVAVKDRRLVPGRNFDISDPFLASIKRHMEELIYLQAVAFKRALDSCFKKGETAEVSFHASDGDTMALMEMVVNGSIRIRPIKVPGTKMGVIKGYTTRRMDKRILEHPVTIEPTDTYVYGLPLPSLTQAAKKTLPAPKGPVPIWYDIHDNLIPLMWKKCLAAVLSAVMLRAGVSAEDMARVLKPVMATWEIREIAEALVDAGAMAKIGEGYVVQEWFWTVIQ